MVVGVMSLFEATDGAASLWTGEATIFHVAREAAATRAAEVIAKLDLDEPAEDALEIVDGLVCKRRAPGPAPREVCQENPRRAVDRATKEVATIAVVVREVERRTVLLQTDCAP